MIKKIAKRTTKPAGDMPDKLDIDAIGSKSEASIKLTEYVKQVDSDFGTSELFHVTWRGQTYSWFVRHGSGNYRRLVKRFGEKPAKWAGNTVDLERKVFTSDDGRKVPYLALV